MFRRLSRDWRDQVKRLGKQYFELLEMARLGFIQADSADTEQLAEMADENARLLAEAAEIRESLPNLDPKRILEKARQRRVTRVRQLAELRRSTRDQDQADAREAAARRRVMTPTYFGAGVSDKVVFDEPKLDRLRSRELPELTTFADLAAALEVTPSQLMWMIYERKVSKTDHYSRFTIPKRSGGTRLIASPKPYLAKAQQWVSSEILSKMPVHDAATAFRPGKSIVDNANEHINAAVLVRIDLKDFFPSIPFERVRHLFMRCGYNSGIASALALICTDASRVYTEIDGQRRVVATSKLGLPQGACTSPAVANLVAEHLDVRMSGLAESLSPVWRYTRYADDLVFSSEDPKADVAFLIKCATEIVQAEGFSINSAKTSIRRPGGRMVVTGVGVDGERLYVPRSEIRRIRAFLHRCETQGLSKVSNEIGKSAAHVAHGYIAYVRMVSPAQAARLASGYDWLKD